MEGKETGKDRRSNREPMKRVRHWKRGTDFPGKRRRRELYKSCSFVRSKEQLLSIQPIREDRGKMMDERCMITEEY